MKQNTMFIVLMVWATMMHDSAESMALPDHTLGGFPPQPERLSAAPSSSRDYSAAIYAGRLAFELERLEKQNNEVFSDFISEGFTEDVVPREFPVHLKMLSRADNPSVAEAFSRSPSAPVGFRFPNENEEAFLNRPRVLRDPTSSTEFARVRRRPFAPSQRDRTPVFTNGFRSVVVPVASESESVFSLNHRFG